MRGEKIIVITHLCTFQVLFYRVGSLPYLQTLDQTGKACQGQIVVNTAPDFFVDFLVLTSFGIVQKCLVLYQNQTAWQKFWNSINNTSFLCNLRIGQISQDVCQWQAFLAKCKVTLLLIGPICKCLDPSISGLVVNPSSAVLPQLTSNHNT